MVAFIEQLRKQRIERAKRVERGMLTGRGAFIETYNNLVGTGKAFTHDAMRDRYYYDGREINGSMLAELRVVAAAGRLVAPNQRTLWDAVRALCRKHPIDGQPEHIKDQWQDAISVILEGDRRVARVVTIHGVPHQCVAMRDLKQALDVRGRDSSRRVYSVMRMLGWQARPVFSYGHRMRGFVKACEIARINEPTV
jgi:hypothetical protein